MPTDDLIRDSSDYERVTGEHPIIPAEPQIQVWERPKRGGKQFYVEDTNFALTIGAYNDHNDDRGDGVVPDDAVPEDATPEQLASLGFTPCTQPELVAMLTSLFHTFTARSEGDAL